MQKNFSVFHLFCFRVWFDGARDTDVGGRKLPVLLGRFRSRPAQARIKIFLTLLSFPGHPEHPGFSNLGSYWKLLFGQLTESFEFGVGGGAEG